MKEKLELRDSKHNHEWTTQEMKEKLVEEILEFFLIKDIKTRTIVKKALVNADMDMTESIDGAIMIWGYDLSVRNNKVK
ncbi:MAG: hypothetical protein WC623_22095 [Pedobacter sp.]|uniref:hypothetical protein n=1 Tax=Pedobacter sp. TaxID=1411316 RepID=UPI003567BEEC